MLMRLTTKLVYNFALEVWHNYLLLLTVNSSHRYVCICTMPYYTLFSWFCILIALGLVLTVLSLTWLSHDCLLVHHHTGVVHAAFVKLNKRTVLTLITITGVPRTCIHSAAKYWLRSTVSGTTIHIILQFVCR
jgi:hypothetical protein